MRSVCLGGLSNTCACRARYYGNQHGFCEHMWQDSEQTKSRGHSSFALQTLGVKSGLETC